jgi:hypothetical protein
MRTSVGTVGDCPFFSGYLHHCQNPMPARFYAIFAALAFILPDKYYFFVSSLPKHF